MKFSFGGIFRTIKHSKWALYPFLAFAPLYMRPLGFVGPNKPMYARLKGLWGAPLVGAGFAWKGGYKLFLWMYFQQASVVAKDTGAFMRMEHVTLTAAWTFFGLTALLIYGFAFLRWSYHLAASTVCCRWGIQASRIPLLYFVVTTATFGFWLGASVCAMAWLFEHWNKPVAEVVAALPVSHPSAILLAVLALGGAMRWASLNSSAGFRQVYGGSARLASFVQLTPACLTLLVLYIYANR